MVNCFGKYFNEFQLYYIILRRSFFVKITNAYLTLRPCETFCVARFNDGCEILTFCMLLIVMFPEALVVAIDLAGWVVLNWTTLPSADLPVIRVWAKDCNCSAEAVGGCDIFRIWLAPCPLAGDTIIIDWLCVVWQMFGFIWRENYRKQSGARFE